MPRVNLTLVILQLRDDSSCITSYVLPGLLDDADAIARTLVLYNEEERMAHEADQQEVPEDETPEEDYEPYDVETFNDEYEVIVHHHTRDLPLTPRRPRPSRNRGRGTILGKPPIE